MKAFWSACILAITLGTVTAEPPKTPDNPEQTRAFELVKQLGSNRYKERELAAAELIKMGRKARPALEAGKREKDPEIYLRCEQLLPQALMLDLLHRIDEYVKDTEGKKTHDLPLLNEFQTKVGKGDLERNLFGDLLKRNGPLFDSIVEEPAKTAEKVLRRSQELYQEIYGNQFNGRGYRPNAVHPNEVTALLFITTLPSYKPAQPDWLLQNLFSQQNYQEALRDEKGGAPHRKIFVSHMESRLDDNMVNQCSYLLCQMKIKEGADILVKAIKEKKLTQTYTRANAMACIGVIGGKEHLPALKDFMKDETVIQEFFAPNNATRGKVKLQDIALAVTIHLSGKNPRDYGFRQWQIYPNQPLPYHQLGFINDQERTDAFKKWETDSQKLPDAKDPPKKEEPKKEEPKKM